MLDVPRILDWRTRFRRYHVPYSTLGMYLYISGQQGNDQGQIRPFSGSLDNFALVLVLHDPTPRHSSIFIVNLHLIATLF